MKRSFHVLDVVAVVGDLPDQGLVRGQVGTIVEILAGDALLVEFSDRDGQTYAMASLHPSQMMRLVHALESAAV